MRAKEVFKKCPECGGKVTYISDKEAKCKKCGWQDRVACPWILMKGVVDESNSEWSIFLKAYKRRHNKKQCDCYK